MGIFFQKKKKSRAQRKLVPQLFHRIEPIWDEKLSRNAKVRPCTGATTRIVAYEYHKTESRIQEPMGKIVGFNDLQACRRRADKRFQPARRADISDNSCIFKKQGLDQGTPIRDAGTPPVFVTHNLHWDSLYTPFAILVQPKPSDPA